MTAGQHIIYGMILSHFSNRLNLVFPSTNYDRLAETIISLDAPEPDNYDLTISEAIEEYPEQCHNLCKMFWDQYEEVFLEIQKY